MRIAEFGQISNSDFFFFGQVSAARSIHSDLQAAGGVSAV